MVIQRLPLSQMLAPMTDAPRLRNASTHALPMPDAAPVTTPPPSGPDAPEPEHRPGRGRWLFLLAVVTLQPFAIYADAEQTVIVLVALLAGLSLLGLEVMTVRIHRRLVPWCPHCQSGGGHGPAPAEPDPRGGITVEPVTEVSHGRQLAQAGRDVLIEPINTRDIAGYLLNRQDEAHAIVAEVGAPNLTDKVWSIEIIKPLAERTRGVYDDLLAGLLGSGVRLATEVAPAAEDAQSPDGAEATPSDAASLPAAMPGTAKVVRLPSESLIAKILFTVVVALLCQTVSIDPPMYM